MDRSTLAECLTGESDTAPLRAPLSLAVAEGFAYSSALVAAVGGSLTLAIGQAMGVASSPRWALLVGSGALLIYNVDRLRDVARDRLASPRRTAFVIRNRAPLAGIAAIGALGVADSLFGAPFPVVLACLAVGAIGLLHRRLKRGTASKVGYVGAAWTTACVGIPWLATAASGSPAGSPTTAFGRVTLIVGASLAANLIASNLRPGKGVAGGRESQRALLLARGLALAATVVAAFAPGTATTLAWIPAAQLIALVRFRPTERHGQLAVDGALLVGAIAAITHGRWLA